MRCTCEYHDRYRSVHVCAERGKNENVLRGECGGPNGCNESTFFTTTVDRSYSNTCANANHHT